LSPTATEHEVAEHNRAERPERQAGDRPNVAGAEDVDKPLVLDGDGLKLGDGARNTGDDPHRRERDEEGRQHERRHEETVDDAHADADAEPGGDREHRAVTLHHVRSDQPGQSDDRPEREVDLAGAEDEDDGDGHHGDGRRLPNDVEQVGMAEKTVVVQRGGEEDEDQEEDGVDDETTRLDLTQLRDHRRALRSGQGATRRAPSRCSPVDCGAGIRDSPGGDSTS
jgi:hypothetical protein